MRGRKIAWRAWFGLLAAVCVAAVAWQVKHALALATTFSATFDYSTLNADYAFGSKTAATDGTFPTLVAGGYGGSAGAIRNASGTTLKYPVLNNLGTQKGEISLRYQLPWRLGTDQTIGVFSSNMGGFTYDSSSGYYFIADTGYDRIIKTKADGTGWTTLGSLGTGYLQFNDPYDVAYDPATEYLFIADYTNSRIVKTKIDGTGWTTYGSNGSGTGKFNYIYEIAYDPATEFIYVSDQNNNRIVKTKIDGTGWTTIGSQGSGANQFRYPQGLAYDPATEFIYVSDRENYRVVKTKIDGTGWTTYGSNGSGVGQFGQVYGLAYEPTTNYLYISDTNRLVKTQMDGTGWTTITSGLFYYSNYHLDVVSGGSTVFAARNYGIAGLDLSQATSYGTSGSGTGQFNQPSGIDYDPATGYYYIADKNNNRIVKTKIDGTGWTAYGTSGSGIGQFASPTYLTYDAATDYIYVYDGNGRLVRTKIDGSGWLEAPVYDIRGLDVDSPSGNLVAVAGHSVYELVFNNVGRYGSYGTGSGQFNYPFDIAYDAASDYYYIADTYNHRIVKTKIDGTGWTTYGSNGTGVGKFNYPYSIDYDPATDFLYITDTSNNRIVKTKIDGTGWTTYGSSGNGSGQFNSLSGIDYDPASDFIYITDRSNNRIVKTKIDGTGWTTYGSSGSGVGQFSSPRGLHYDAGSDTLFLIDSSNYRVVKTKIDGTGWTTYGQFSSTYYGPDSIGSETYGLSYNPTTHLIYLANSRYHRITVFKDDGTNWQDIPVTYPAGVQYDPTSNRLIVTRGVSQNTASSIGYLPADIAIVGNYGGGAGKFDTPSGVAADPNSDYVYVSDYGGDRIVKTKMDGTGWTTFGRSGYDKNQFRGPSWLNFEPATGFLTVHDSGNARYIHTKMDGTDWSQRLLTGTRYSGYFNASDGLLTIGLAGSIVRQPLAADVGRNVSDPGKSISGPRDVAYDQENGDLYIMNAGTRVLKMKMDGSSYESIGSSAGIGDYHFSGATGLDYDETNGYVYVADSTNNRIVRTKMDGSEWTTYGTYGSGTGQFKTPQDLFVDESTGYIYVADVNNSRIVRTKIDGTGWTTMPVYCPSSVTYLNGYVYAVSSNSPYLYRFKDQNSGFVTTNLTTSPADVQYDEASDYVYVLDGSSNGRVIKTRPDGTDQTILTGFYNARGLYYDAATDFVYVADYGYNRIVRSKMDGTERVVYLASYPNDLWVDSAAGYMYVGDSAGLTKINLNDTLGLTQSNSIAAVSYDAASGYYYLAENGYPNSRIIKTKIDGTGWTTYGSYGSGTGQFQYPAGIWYDAATDYIFVADTDNNRIVKTKIDGTGWTVSGISGLNDPRGLFYDSASGDLYTADMYNYRIVKAKFDGSGRTNYGSQGSGTGQFSNPYDVSVDVSTGYVYVADRNNYRIVKTKMDGTGWTAYGSQGAGTGNFNRPNGLAYDPASGYIYVADTDNNRLVKTQIDGTGWEVSSMSISAPSNVDLYGSQLVVSSAIYFGKCSFDRSHFGTAGTGTNQFQAVKGIYYDASSGYFYLADNFNHRLVKTKYDGTGWTTYGSQGTSRSTAGLFYQPQHIDVDLDTGDVYVADYVNSRLVKTKMDGTGWTPYYGTSSSVVGVSLDRDVDNNVLLLTSAGLQRLDLDGYQNYTGSTNMTSLRGTYHDGYWYLSQGESTNPIIIKTTTDGSSFSTYGTYGGGAGQFNYPYLSDLDHSTGYLYIADNNNSRIVRVQANGTGWSTINTGYSDGEKTLLATNGTQPLKVSWLPNESRLEVHLAKAAGGLALGKSAVLTGSEGDWQNLKLVYDNTSGVTVSVNDTEVMSKSATWSSYSWGEHFYLGNNPFDNTQAFTGLIDDIQVSSTGADTTAPAIPTLTAAKNETGGSVDLTTDHWYPHSAPNFTWSATDDGGAGLKDYLVYWGTDASSDVQLYGTAQAAGSYVPSNLVSGTTYYLRVMARDNAANLSSATTLFTYKYDPTKPESPTNISVTPPGNSRETHFDFAWAVSGSGSGSDTGGSGLQGYQYRIQNKNGVYGDWSAVSNDGVGSFNIPAPDTDYIGTNHVEVRAVDNAGNADETPVINSFYYSAAATAPRNLTVSPTGVSSTNEFSFNWDEPTSYPGQGYYYSINVLPTATNKLTVADSALTADAYASQQGENTLYVLAADGDSTNYDSCATITGNSEVDACAKVDFYAETPAPGYPGNLKTYDISNRDTSEYAVALKWSAPANLGTGFDGYNVYRSTNATGYFNRIGASSGASYIDDGLAKETPYYYYLKSKDNTGQESIASQTVSVTPTGKYTNPPTLKDGSLGLTVKAYSAVITWQTTRADSTDSQAGKSSSFVKYGLTRATVGKENGGWTVGDPNKLEDHSVTVTGLEPSTTYYYQIMWEDIDGNQGTNDIATFSTKEKPLIGNVTADNITLRSANINWESVNMVSARVNYCSPTACAERTMSSAADQTSHTVNLSGLDHSTTYKYTISTTDIDGNVTPSDTYYFATLTMPLVEGDLKMDQDAAAPTTTYRFRWLTNIETTTILNYTREGSPTQTVSKADYTKEHDVVVSGLADQSKYSFEATGVDNHGNRVDNPRTSSVSTPQDSRSPVVSGLTIEIKSSGASGTQKDQIVASWETDELATSQIEYAPGISGSEYTLRTKEDAALTNYHVAIISELDPSKMYHLRVVSKDAAGNAGYSEDTTAITGKIQNSIMDLIMNSLQKSLGWLAALFR